MNKPQPYNVLLEEGNPKSSSKVQLGILNLMPNKEKTEVAFKKIFSQYRKPINICLLKFDSYQPQNVDPKYFKKNYCSIWNKIRSLDALIITGAPVEELLFEQVKYWDEIIKLFDEIVKLNIPTYKICWAAQAALKHFYSITKKVTSKKVFGIFSFACKTPQSSILKNIVPPFCFPASRHSESNIEQIASNNNIEIILQNNLEEGGIFLAKDKKKPFYYTFGHCEYDTKDMKEEYERDTKKGRKDVEAPKNYDISSPKNTWSKNGQTLLYNWLNEALSVKRL